MTPFVSSAEMKAYYRSHLIEALAVALAGREVVSEG